MDDNPKIREMPASKEAEMMVLGCMLTSIHSLNIAAEALDDAAFFYIEHKIIFHALKSAYKSDKPADVHLICEELKRQEKLKTVGGPAFITGLAQYAGTSAYIEEYVGIVKERHMSRDIIRSCQRGIDELLDQEDPSKTLLTIQENFRQIERHGCTKDKFPIRFLNQFEDNFLLTVPPPKPMLLETTQGVGFLPKSIVAMLVGAGGVGKTHLLAQLAIAVASGSNFLETYRTTEFCGEGGKGNVFFGLGENQYDDIHRVLYKAAQKFQAHQPDILIGDPLLEASKKIALFSFCGQHAAFLEEKKPSQYFRRLKMKLIDTAPKDGWSLIILDPVSRLLGADAEKDNASATQFISLLEELIFDLPGKPTVLFAHHVSKAAQHGDEVKKSQSASRGASALTDGSRWQANLYKADPVLVVEMTKTNFTEVMAPIYLEKMMDGCLKTTCKRPLQKQTKKVTAHKTGYDRFSTELEETEND